MGRIAWAILAALALVTTAANAADVSIPVIGCPQDGQTGPIDAPPNASRSLSLDPAAAAQLAFYTTDSSSQGGGVLAPRGWYCFGTYGSSGENLFIAPVEISSNEIFSGGKWKGFTGPAIQYSLTDAETSGRFEAARIIAQIFPQKRDFVLGVIAEGIEPASDFPFGPSAQDQINHVSDNVVLYETPPGAKGLGTHSFLLPNSEVIKGIVILGDQNSIVQLAVRLPKENSNLTDAIIRQFEN